MQTQAPNLRQRHKQDDDVGKNSRSSVRNPCADLVDAAPWQMGIPQLLHGDADEDEEKSDADDPGHDEGPDDPSQLLEIGEAEDPVVHQQQAQFGPSEVECVEDLGHDQPFRHHDNVCWVNQVGVDAHAAGMHGKDEAHNGKIPDLEATRSKSEKEYHFAFVRG